MIEDPQGLKNSFNERMRLIRFRRKKENLRFWQEFKLVPRWLIWTVVVLFLIAQIIGQMVLHVQLANHQEVFGPELDNDPGAARAAALQLPAVRGDGGRALQLLPQLQMQPAPGVPAVQAGSRGNRQVLRLLRPRLGTGESLRI